MANVEKEKITEETEIGTVYVYSDILFNYKRAETGSDKQAIRFLIDDLDVPYRTMVLSYAEKESNAKKAKAWDDLIKIIQVEMFKQDKEGNIEARDAFYTVESWMQDLLQM